jgi:HK97 family phage major capsid protein
MNINALRQAKADLLNEERQLRSEAGLVYKAVREASREISDEEKTRDDEIAARLEAISTETASVSLELVNAEKLATLEKETPIVINTGDDLSKVEVIGEVQEQDASWGFKGLADFAHSVKGSRSQGITDPRLATPFMQNQMGAPTNVHKELGTDEGRMVPPEYRKGIWEHVFADQIVSRFNFETTSSNSVEIVTDESTPWGSTGIQAYWTAEGAQITTSKLATNGVSVKLNKLAALVAASDELLQDAPLLNSRLTRGAGMAIADKISDALINGDGVGKPLGFLVGGSLVSVAKDTSQTAATFTAGNAANIYSRALMSAASFWAVNPIVIAQVMLATLGDNGVYMLPQAGFVNAPDGFLLGKPIARTEHMAALGTAGDAVLVDPTGYAAYMGSEGNKFDSSIHLFFDYGVSAFRWTVRVGGRPYASAAITGADGSTTSSHFVTVAVRS